MKNQKILVRIRLSHSSKQTSEYLSSDTEFEVFTTRSKIFGYLEAVERKLQKLYPVDKPELPTPPLTE